jgi:hypothetical protein
MINNFPQIRNLLKFENKDDFYFLQILKRRKDNPDLEYNEITIKNYFIDSLEYFDKKKERIIKHCKLNNARAYIRLNIRNYKKVALETLRIVTDNIIKEEYRTTKSAFDSAAGRYHSDKNKKWLVDIDGKGEVNDLMINIVTNHIERLQKEFTPEYKIIDVIPTVNGVHIITNPFNINEFRKTEICKSIEIHKDNPTLLYFDENN